MPSEERRRRGTPTAGVVGRGGWIRLYFGDDTVSSPYDTFVRVKRRGHKFEVVDLFLHANGERPIDARLEHAISVEAIRRFATHSVDWMIDKKMGVGSGIDIGALIWGAEFEPSDQDPVLIDIEGEDTMRVDPMFVVPASRRRDESFYQSFADLYRSLEPVTRNPASVIAKRNSHPLATVHGWVREARQRGYLPPGRSRRRDE